MKFCTIVLAVFAVCTAAAFSSCTQEYRCECTINYAGRPGLPDSVVRNYSITDTKKKAKSLCAEKSASYEKDGVTTTETCVLF